MTLTELALLGLGQGLPAPGPLEFEKKQSFRKSKRNMWNWNQYIYRKGREHQFQPAAQLVPYMLIPGMPGPRELGGGLIPPP